MFYHSPKALYTSALNLITRQTQPSLNNCVYIFEPTK